MQKSVIDQLKRKQIAALLEQDKRIFDYFGYFNLTS